jgi:hypothetical protein
MNFIAKILLNSLYGRFGMDDNFSIAKVIHKDLATKYELAHLDNLRDIIELENHKIILSETVDENSEKAHNVSIAVAAAITAYSRIHMSQFKNNPKINLYYTDTDSVYTDSDLDENLISNIVLGALKLEYFCEKAIFLGPKSYCLKLSTGKLITKIKGLKNANELSFTDFEKLLTKDAFIVKNQLK